MSERMFDVGKIVNTHGIRGEVKVQRITDFEERFQVGNKLYIVSNNSLPLEVEIASHRVHKQLDLLSFKGYDNINDVTLFIGSFLKIKEDQQTELPEGEYYYHEIIGCLVKTTNGDNIGEIYDIFPTGANDVWVVKPKKGKDILIPYIEDIVKQVDVETKQVIIEPMEGLLD